MIRRSTIASLAGLMMVGSLVASPLAASGARAQEAIMLETIGAVRMARPSEVERMNDNAALERQRVAVPAPTAPDRHAAVAD